MPQNLTDASSWDTATAPVGGDVRNAASVATALQAAANRARFVYDRATPLADVAALKAIASPADGLVRLVELLGFYVFDAASAAAESLPWLVQPTVGTGRWVHSLYGVLGVANSLATLDGSSKVVQPVPNRIVAMQQDDLGALFTTSSTSYVDVTGLSVTVAACEVGDVLLVDAALICGSTVGSHSGYARVVAVDPAATIVGPACACAVTGAIPSTQAVTGVRTVATAGDVIVKAQLSSNNVGSTVSVSESSTLRVIHIRP